MSVDYALVGKRTPSVCDDHMDTDVIIVTWAAVRRVGDSV